MTISMDSLSTTRRGALKMAAGLAGGALLGGSLWACSPGDESSGSGSAATASGEVTAGVYRGQAPGLGGPVSVAAFVDSNGRVSDITIDQNHETYGFACIGMQKMASDVISGQTLNVDSFTGATMSCAAFRVALTEALEKAGVAEQFKNAEAYTSPVADLSDMEADVVIVGGGLAGMMCAIQAKRNGKDVVLLEKMPYFGGSMVRSDSTWECAGGQTGVSRLGGDAWPLYFDHTTPITARQFAHLGKVFDEMTAMGVEWTPFEDDPLAQYWMDGTRQPQYRWREANACVTAAFNRAMEAEGVVRYAGVTVTDVIEEGGAAVGVTAQQANGNEFTVQADSVVLATGNYSRNPEYCLPDYAQTTMLYVEGDTGDALSWIQKFNGQTHDLDSIPGFVSCEDSGRNILYFTGDFSLVVDVEGNRFVSEGNGTFLDYLYIGSAAIANNADDPTHYFILDRDLYAQYPARMELEELLSCGYAKKLDTLDEVVSEYGLANLNSTIDHYNDMVAAGEDADFGRTMCFQEFSKEGPYWVITGHPGIYVDFGGIVVDAYYHVLDQNGERVPGLYAIGQTLGDTGLYEGLEDYVYDPSLTGNCATGWLLGRQLCGVFEGGTYVGACETAAGEVQVKLTVDDDRTVSAADVSTSTESAENMALLEEWAKSAVADQALPGAGSPTDLYEAFEYAFNVALVKADNYLEFIGEGEDA